jgi:signal recognition particle GTPase
MTRTAEGDEEQEECMCVILYPKVVLDQSPNMEWVPSFLNKLLAEFDLFYNNAAKHEQTSVFHKTFQALYKEAEQQRTEQVLASPPSRTASASDLSSSRHSQTSTNTAGKKRKGGKEARVWHDSEQKVTQKSMAKLDRSKNDSKVNLAGDADPMDLDDSSPAVREARAAYLPQEHELLQEEDGDTLVDSSEDSNEGGWGSSLKGMMDSISGKVLTESDLDSPLADMEKLLTSKNVAGSIAKEICQSVKVKLIGKKMNSFARVKTAVRQALEVSIQRVLRPGVGRGGGEEVDVLRNVVTLRESGAAGLFRKAAEKTRPYVIVMGKCLQYRYYGPYFK